MQDFLQAIPTAASSPYALAAYAIAAVIFLFAGAKLRLTKMLLTQVSTMPLSERRRALEIATGTILPTNISAEQWIRNNRIRWFFLTLASLMIVVMVIATVAVVNTNKVPRHEYSLQPLELLFVIEYPMDQPPLSAYIERLEKEITESFRESRGDPNFTLEEIAVDHTFIITHKPEWKPTGSSERDAARHLLQDNTAFTLSTAKKLGKEALIFLSTSKDTADALKTMKPIGEIFQQIDLQADFGRRVLIKSVICRNPVRTGGDIAPIGAWDLVGRKLTWSHFGVSDLSWELISLGFRFSYDNSFEQNHATLPNSRVIKTEGRDSVIIKAEHIGLSN